MDQFFSKSIWGLICYICISIYPLKGVSNPSDTSSIARLENPMSVEYLQESLAKTQPRLILDKTKQEILLKKLKTNPAVQNLYKAIKFNAETIMSEPLLERKQIGMRLLYVSREMLYRMNILGLVYVVEKDPEVLERISKELIAVSRFRDWNPSHFLDVAEMSLAVALALDWTAGDLPDTTIAIAKSAVIEKGLIPSWTETDGYFPFYNPNNWNQVCNGAMIAAAITVAEEEPELAAKTISRALEGLPSALHGYGPDGVYPEGSSYWEYATAYSVLTVSMLESAFGRDFGYSETPGFMESALFRTLSNAPSGWYYNFGDCDDSRSENGDMILAWFASRTGNKNYFEHDRFLRPADEMGKLERWAGAAMIWIAGFGEENNESLPAAWKGEGANPVVIFRGKEDDPHHYYFGGKGGRGQVANHGNMDAGSFVFELNGVRWSVDPGRQHYHDLEKVGFDLWNMCQDCERWTLLAQNNHGHSTITINDELHLAGGLVPLVDFNEGSTPTATFNLTPAFGKLVTKAERTFTKDSEQSLIIEDQIVLSSETNSIKWQMMTTADVELFNGYVVLNQDGKRLYLKILSHKDLNFSVVSLNPTPMQLDKKIDNLKRVEIQIPAWYVTGNELNLKVQLSGSE